VTNPTLKLPEPLPYDFVDALIDEQISFFEDTDSELHEGIVYSVTRIWCRPVTATEFDPGLSNWGRSMFEVVSDGYSFLGEDEEGYSDTSALAYLSGMCWTAKELTDEEIDYKISLAVAL
jgi:hypothetical protein